MKVILRSSVFIILCMPFIFPIPSFAASNQKLALVIGNGSYRSAPLRNPVNDATDIASALKRLGFSVTLETDVNKRTIEDAMRLFGKNLRKGGVGLFYYAGHGVQVDGRNYLIPIGARIETESEVAYEAVDAGRVLGQMEDAGNGLNIIILDACRDNPFARSFRSSSSGLSKMDAPEGSILSYATAPGKIAADSDGRNGLFTAKLLKHMMTPGVPIEQFFKRVRMDVRKESGKKQIPWTESSLIGDFAFYPQKGQGLDAQRALLEQERRELEGLKADIDERKKIDAERKRIEDEKSKLLNTQPPRFAALPPSVTDVRARDAHYEKYANGIVKDTKTGLEWYAGPDKNTNWNDAKSWVANLSVGGGGWRMPTKEELKSLYKNGAGSRNMTALLETTGWYVWSGETRDSSSAWTFSFTTGPDYWNPSPSHNLRGFAVRSRR